MMPTIEPDSVLFDPEYQTVWYITSYTQHLDRLAHRFSISGKCIHMNDCRSLNYEKQFLYDDENCKFVIPEIWTYLQLLTKEEYAIIKLGEDACPTN